MEELKEKKEIIKINGKLRELITLKNLQGETLYRILNPLRLEFRLRDLIQIIVGASILAIPVGFTEETWKE